MSTIKSRLEKIEGKMRTKSNYAEIIRKHAIEHKEGYGKDEGMMVHTIMALYINSKPEHKYAMNARNYLEWANGQEFDLIPRAYSAIKDLIADGLATFAPREFISDGRDTSSIIPPYPYLCTADQLMHFSDNQFWADLK